jgi:hypothetical protein
VKFNLSRAFKIKMKSLTRHHVEIGIPELHISGVETSQLICEFLLKGEALRARFPLEEPIIFEVADLRETDIMSIRVLQGR